MRLKIVIFTESHRMAEVEKDLWRSSGPNHLLKQGRLDQAAQPLSMARGIGTG